jgi:hypothetical protein
VGTQRLPVDHPIAGNENEQIRALSDPHDHRLEQLSDRDPPSLSRRREVRSRLEPDDTMGRPGSVHRVESWIP